MANDSLAVLLPVYNAQHSLTDDVVRALEISTELTRRCEIAVIDDGSDDDTEEIACDLALKYPQVIVARHHRPRGMEEAIHTGVQATHGSILMIVPPETELRPAEIRRLWRNGTGANAPPTERPNAAAGDTPPANGVTRLMKSGQALREEQASHGGGVRMVRREMYRRPVATKRVQPARIEQHPAHGASPAPNMLTQLRDFAFGE